MSFLLSCVVVIGFALVFRKPIKKYPILFYVLAIAISVAGIYFTLSPNPAAPIRALVFAIQKGHVGLAMFTLVMFIGVFDKGSAVRRMFNPIRAELSIMAALLIAGHLTPYLSNYIGMATALFSFDINILVSLTIALVMLILLIILTVTSFNAIKQKMEAGTWKKVQLLAYPFFGLIFFHLLGYLIVPALHGSSSALVSLVVYAVMFAAYTILRIRKAFIDRKIPENSRRAEAVSKPI